MHILDSITGVYGDILHFIAGIAVYTLELVGIFIIVVGSIRVIMQTVATLRKKQSINVVIELGRTLALALEFKMGAEIVNTVIIRELSELVILAIIIALRAFLALLIHWEITSERRHEEAKNKPDTVQESTEAKE